MNIPNLPTDNIYKFAAIFGLIIFAGSIYLYQISDKKIHDAEIQADLSYHKKILDSINATYSRGFYEMKRNMFREKTKNDSLLNIDKEVFLKEYAELEKEYFEVQKIQDEYRSSINNSYKSNTDLVYYKFEQRTYNLLAETFIWFGILLIAWGFASWYFKHQIYIDAEIKWKGENYRELLKDAKEIEKSKEVKTEIKDDAPDYKESARN